MSTLRPILLIVWCLTCWPSGWAVSAATFPQAVADLSLEPEDVPRSLMLRNGAVYTGVIRQTGGRYLVAVDARTHMSFDPLQVWAVADHVADLYEYRRTRIKADDTAGRIGLVRWCVTQKLLPEAEEELRTLRGRDVPPEQLRSLELMVGNAQRMSDPRGTELAESGTLGARPVPSLPPRSALVPSRGPGALPASANGRVSSPGVSPGSTTAGRSNPLASAPGSMEGLAGPSTGPLRPTPPVVQPLVPARSASPSAAEPRANPVVNSVFSFYDQPGFQNDARVQTALDNRVQQEVVSEFTESVHWTLVQACAGCHYPENQRLQQVASFVLEIPSGQHKATVAQTRHNLSQLMTLIDPAQPGNSRLLGYLERTHGPLTEPPISRDSEDLTAVREWILRSGRSLVAADDRSRVVPASAPLAVEARGPEQALAESRSTGLPSPGLPSPGLPSPGLPSPGLPASAGGLPAGAGGDLGWTFGRGPQVDLARPYDPAPFNQFYHPDRVAGVRESQRDLSGAVPGLPNVGAADSAGARSRDGRADTADGEEFAPPVGLPRIRRSPASPPSNQTLLPRTEGGK